MVLVVALAQILQNPPVGHPRHRPHPVEYQCAVEMVDLVLPDARQIASGLRFEVPALEILRRQTHLPGAQASAPARRLVVLRAEGDVDGSYQWRLAPGPAER